MDATLSVFPINLSLPLTPILDNKLWYVSPGLFGVFGVLFVCLFLDYSTDYKTNSQNRADKILI